MSDVIGISFLCGNQICPTSNISLVQPVVITFQHSSSLTVSYSKSKVKRLFKHEFITGCAGKQWYIDNYLLISRIYEQVTTFSY